MKRDIDLIKYILLEIEEKDGLSGLPEYSDDLVQYHLALLQDAGLVVQEQYFNLAKSPTALLRTRMTWAGHEFLDASRSDAFWAKAKKTAMEKTGALSFEVVKTILIQLAKEAVSPTH